MMPVDFPWCGRDLSEKFQKDNSDIIILRVFREGTNAYIDNNPTKSFSIGIMKELWESYIAQLPEERLKNNARKLESYVIYSPQTVLRTFSEIMKAAILISIPDRLQMKIGVNETRRREDEMLGYITFTPNYTNNTVTLSASLENKDKEKFENFVRDNELQSSTSKFQGIFDYITPETVYNKYAVAKCALWFIDTFRADFLEILNDEKVKTALIIGEISFSSIMKALSDRYAYYLGAYVLKKIVDYQFRKIFHQCVTEILGTVSGDILPQPFNFLPSNQAHSDMVLLVDEYVTYFKAGIGLQVAPAITMTQRARQQFAYRIFAILIGLCDEDKREIITEFIQEDLKLNLSEEYLSDPYELIIPEDLSATMSHDELWTSLCSANASFFDSFDKQKSGNALYQLAALNLWEAFVSDDRGSEWINVNRTIDIRQVIYDESDSIVHPILSVEQTTDSDSFATAAAVTLVEEHKEILLKFRHEQHKNLVLIDELVAEPSFYKHRLRCLWDSFAHDQPLTGSHIDKFLNNSKINDPFLEIIFDSHLEEVIAGVYLDSVDIGFEMAMEAVAIAWCYPAILNEASLEGINDWANLAESFKVAVNWMRIHSDYTNSIHNLYDSADALIVNWKQNNERQVMLKKIIPEFLRVLSDSKKLTELSEENGLKKITALAIPADIIDMIGPMLKAIRSDQASINQLEIWLLQFSRIILEITLKDLEKIFPDVNEDTEIFCNLLMFQISALADQFIQPDSVQGFDYCVVLTATKKIIPSFLEKFLENPKKEKNSNIYVMLQQYIDECFGRDCVGVDYRKVFSGLNNDFKSFVSEVFIKLAEKLLKHPIVFYDIFLFKQLIDANVFVPAINRYLLRIALRGNKSDIELQILEIFKNNIELLPDIISHMSTLENSDSVISIITFLLNTEIDKTIEVFCGLLEESASKADERSLLSLAKILPPSRIDSSTLAENDQGVQNLAKALNARKDNGLEPAAIILNSNLLLLNRLRLIGAIAHGKNSRNKSPLNRTYSALESFYNIKHENEVKDRLASFEEKVSNQFFKKRTGGTTPIIYSEATTLLHNAPLQLILNNTFFGLVLQLVQQSTQAMQQCGAAVVPITQAFFSPGEVYDDSNVLLRCDAEQLIGLFILAMMYEVLTEKYDDISYANWLSHLFYLFSIVSPKNNKEVLKENIHSLGANGINTFFQQQQPPRYLKQDVLNELKDQLPPPLEDQDAYLNWFNQRQSSLR